MQLFVFNPSIFMMIGNLSSSSFPHVSGGNLSSSSFPTLLIGNLSVLSHCEDGSPPTTCGDDRVEIVISKLPRPFRERVGVRVKAHQIVNPLYR
jgi:hypothetical protein